MLTIIHVVISVINAILRDVAHVLVAGSAIVLTAITVLIAAGIALGISGFGAFRFLKKRRSK